MPITYVSPKSLKLFSITIAEIPDTVVLYENTSNNISFAVLYDTKNSKAKVAIYNRSKRVAVLEDTGRTVEHYPEYHTFLRERSANAMILRAIPYIPEKSRYVPIFKYPPEYFISEQTEQNVDLVVDMMDKSVKKVRFQNIDLDFCSQPDLANYICDANDIHKIAIKNIIDISKIRGRVDDAITNNKILAILDFVECISQVNLDSFAKWLIDRSNLEVHNANLTGWNGTFVTTIPDFSKNDLFVVQRFSKYFYDMINIYNGHHSSKIWFRVKDGSEWVDPSLRYVSSDTLKNDNKISVSWITKIFFKLFRKK